MQHPMQHPMQVHALTGRCEHWDLYQTKGNDTLCYVWKRFEDRTVTPKKVIETLMHRVHRVHRVHIPLLNPIIYFREIVRENLVILKFRNRRCFYKYRD